MRQMMTCRPQNMLSVSLKVYSQSTESFQGHCCKSMLLLLSGTLIKSSKR
jgi:hypothetical protein